MHHSKPYNFRNIFHENTYFFEKKKTLDTGTITSCIYIYTQTHTLRFFKTFILLYTYLIPINFCKRKMKLHIDKLILHIDKLNRFNKFGNF